MPPIECLGGLRDWALGAVMKESADRDGECPKQHRTHVPRFDIRE